MASTIANFLPLILYRFNIYSLKSLFVFNHVQHGSKDGSESIWQHAEMDTSPLCNPFADQNQNSHKSLRSLVYPTRQDSAPSHYQGPTRQGSTYTTFTTFFLFLFLFCSVHAIAHSKNSRADFRHVYVKRRGLAQRSAFWGLIDTT